MLGRSGQPIGCRRVVLCLQPSLLHPINRRSEKRDQGYSAPAAVRATKSFFPPLRPTTSVVNSTFSPILTCHVSWSSVLRQFPSDGRRGPIRLECPLSHNLHKHCTIVDTQTNPGWRAHLISSPAVRRRDTLLAGTLTPTCHVGMQPPGPFAHPPFKPCLDHIPLVAFLPQWPFELILAWLIKLG